MLERAQVVDVGQLYALWREVATAINDGDIERWLALWIHDGIQMPSGTRRRVGLAQIQRGIQPLFDRFYIKEMSIHVEEIRILGQWAFAHGAFAFEKTSREGGETKRYAGSFLNVLKREVDGSWKIAIDCHNFNSTSEELWLASRRENLPKRG